MGSQFNNRKKILFARTTAFALFLTSNVMADNATDINLFEQQLREIEISYMDSLLFSSIKAGPFGNYNLQLTDQEREDLVNELHYNFRRAKDAILNGRQAVGLR